MGSKNISEDTMKLSKQIYFISEIHDVLTFIGNIPYEKTY